MKIYTILGGVNGVGKSSLYGSLNLSRTDLGIIIDADKITASLGGDKLQGGKQAVKRISECLENGINFTQETTLSGTKTLRTIKSARERGFYVRLYYVAVGELSESLSRIENRVRKGGHDIPRDDVTRRFNKRFEDVLRVLPFCDEVHFIDNENGFVKVGEYKNGSLITFGENTPEWIRELRRKHDY